MIDPKDLNREKVKIEIQAKKKQEKKFKLIDSTQLYNGHSLWEMSPDGQIKKAEYAFSLNKNITWEQAIKKEYLNRSGKVLYKKNHLYCTALNYKNAAKQFEKMKSEFIEIKGKPKPKNPLRLK